MNIYKKIIIISKEFLEANVKKSGQNKYAGFKYFTLDDLEPTLIRLMDEYNIYIEFNFEEHSATATIINIDQPEEIRILKSPMPKLDLKGANPIQEMGSQQTYLRRYFLLNIFHISEPDFFDATMGKKEQELRNKIKAKFNEDVKSGKTSAQDIYNFFPEAKQINSLSYEQLTELYKKVVMEVENV